MQLAGKVEAVEAEGGVDLRLRVFGISMYINIYWARPRAA